MTARENGRLEHEIAALRRMGGGYRCDPTRLGIRDPRGFVKVALDDELRSKAAHLDPDKYEEAVSYLTERLCRLAGRYDPKRGGLAFTTYAYRILRQRYTDWLREDRGDARRGNDGRTEAHADIDALFRSDIFSADEAEVLSLIAEIDHEKLSARARGALRGLIHMMVAEDLSATEAAERFGKSRREATRDLDRLRQELLAT